MSNPYTDFAALWLFGLGLMALPVAITFHAVAAVLEKR